MVDVSTRSFAPGALALVALVASACKLTVPLGPDRAELATAAPATKPGVPLEVMPMVMGRATAPRCVPAGEKPCRTAVDVVHAAFLVKHPRGAFVVDAGLRRGAKADLARFSFVVHNLFEYRHETSLADTLDVMARAGWPRPERYLVTHAHWDHTSGLVDLEKPRVVLGPGEAEFVRAYPADKTPTVMPHHLAQATLETFAWDGPAFETFPVSHDLFQDGSVILVPLPGHTPGSYGVVLTSVRGRRVIFVGDAAWSRDAIAAPSHKLAPISEIVDTDTGRGAESLWRLHHLARRDPTLLVVPTHDGAAVEELRALVTTPGSSAAAR